MRDETDKPRRPPRKHTQRKPKGSLERFRTPAEMGLLSWNEDVDQPSSAEEKSKRLLSPMHSLTSPPSIPPTPASADSLSSELTGPEDNDSLPNSSNQEPRCAFCNCGSEMSQILGSIAQYQASAGFSAMKYSEVLREKVAEERGNSMMETESDMSLPGGKRPVGGKNGQNRRRRKKMSEDKATSMTPDMTTFGTEQPQDPADVFDMAGLVWAHHCCAAWSAGVCQTDSYDLENVDKAALKALITKCSHCNRYGASTECQIQKCTKMYHYPCCASSGAFQDIKSMTLLCSEHQDHAERLAGTEAYCVLCDEVGNLSSQLFCTSCGRHYHGSCLQPKVEVSAIVRMGWQCPECKVCQGCRQPGDDDKMLCCDVCDKGFHIYCLNPPMSVVPKTGWKCVGCRKCEDCGSNVPGGGPTCRWHFNYSVCDRCYQQRKKGQSCPVCGKAVRQFAGDSVIQCKKCTKWVHIDCDDAVGTDDNTYSCPTCKRIKGDLDPDGPFPNTHEDLSEGLPLQPFETPVDNFCDSLMLEDNGLRTLSAAEAAAISRTATGFLPREGTNFMPREPSPLLGQHDMDELGLKGIGINFDEVMMETDLGNALDDSLLSDLDDMKPDMVETLDSTQVPRLTQSADPFLSGLDQSPSTRVSSSLESPGRTLAQKGKKKPSPFRGRGRSPGTPGRGRRTKNVDRRSGKPGRPGRPRTKSVSWPIGANKENIQVSSATPSESLPADELDETEGLHSTVVVVSNKDQFSMSQDICMCCGSFGKGKEGYLITCAQCGQCFHPFCVNVKVNKVIMTKGWRCLDCTVCEGCGKNTDEGKLLLCDNCDISYHIYCLDPPLKTVPQGGWKCQWCVECSSCGSRTPGFASDWMSNYTLCGPCASEGACPICNKPYLDDELTMQCDNCHRWLHAECDGLATEEDAELAAQYGYHCSICRPHTGHYGVFSSSLTEAIVDSSYIHGKSNSPSYVNVSQLSAQKFGSSAVRRTKTLHNLKQNMSKFGTPPERTPLQAVHNSISEFGTVEVTLPGMKLKPNKDEVFENENSILTDVGLKQIKSLIVRAPLRMNRNKDKLTKIDIAEEVRTQEGEVKTSGQITDTKSPGMDLSDGRQPICAPGMDGMPANVPVPSSPGPPAKRVAKASRRQKPPSSSISAVDFFGSKLVNKKNNIVSGDDTQSSDEDSKKAKEPPAVTAPPTTKRKPSREKKAKAVTSPRDPSFPQSSSASWASKLESEATTSKAPDQSRNLYLGILGNEDPNTNRTVGQHPHPHPHAHAEQSREMEGRESQMKKMHPGQSHGGSFPMNNQLTPTGDLDLMGFQELPHVESHVVEEIFAGIEREMSMDGTQPSHGRSPLDSSVVEYQGENTVYTREKVPTSMKEPTFTDYSQAHTTPSSNATVTTVTSGFTSPPSSLPGQNFASHPDVYQTNRMTFNHNFGPGVTCPSTEAAPGMGETDPFKAVFGEEPEVKPKSREGASSPKIDSQKQLKKWEQDEKLGEFATISPVLYANLMHLTLKNEYPEWPNRARAIARLWRKLPAEQREPFRLRARDNRVKQKDQGRRVGPYKNLPASSADQPSEHLPPRDLPINPQIPGQVPALSTPVTSEGILDSSSLFSPGSASSVMNDSFQSLNPTLAGAPGFVSPQSHQEFNPESEEQRLQHSMLSPQSAQQLSENSFRNSVSIRTTVPGLEMARLQAASSSLDLSLQHASARPTTPLEARIQGRPSTESSPSNVHKMFPFSGNVSEPPVSVDSAPSTKGGRGKGKSTREEKEKEKEKRRRKNAIAQEKERQWRMLQQQRLMEQQQQPPQPGQSNQSSDSQGATDVIPSQSHDENGAGDSMPSNVASNKDLELLASLSTQENLGRLMTPHDSVTTTASGIDTTAMNSEQSVGVDQLTRSMLSPTGPHHDVGHEADSGRKQFDQLSLLVQEANRATAYSTTDISIHDNSITYTEDMSSRYTDAAHDTRGGTVGNLPQDCSSKSPTEASNQQTNDPNTIASSSTGTTDTSFMVKEHSSLSSSLPTVPESHPQTSVITYPGDNTFANRSYTDITTTSLDQSNVTQATSQGIADNSASSDVSREMTESPVIAVEPAPKTKSKDGKSRKKTEQQAPIPGNTLPGGLLGGVTQVSGASAADQAFLSQMPQQQQQAFLFQQQQFMAAQQQYIQWQLQQQQAPEVFSGSTPSYSFTDKDLPEVDSEEQHQERIRYLYRQRQLQKQQLIQMQQSMQTQQMMMQQQASGSGMSNMYPAVDPVQQQQMLQQQQRLQEALQQQLVLEYNRRLQQRGELGQGTANYDKVLAELAQQYGYPHQVPNTPMMQLVHQRFAWRGPNPNFSGSPGTFPANPQQLMQFGSVPVNLDEDKTKELSAQQLYTLQLQQQHQLMIQQMALGNVLQGQAAPSTQSPAPSGSRKSSVSSTQEKGKDATTKKGHDSAQSSPRCGSTSLIDQSQADTKSQDSFGGASENSVQEGVNRLSKTSDDMTGRESVYADKVSVIDSSFGSHSEGSLIGRAADCSPLPGSLSSIYPGSYERQGGLTEETQESVVTSKNTGKKSRASKSKSKNAALPLVNGPGKHSKGGIKDNEIVHQLGHDSVGKLQSDELIKGAGDLPSISDSTDSCIEQSQRKPAIKCENDDSCDGPGCCTSPKVKEAIEGGCGRPEGCGTPPQSPQVVASCGRPEGCGTPPRSPAAGDCGRPEGCGTPPGSSTVLGDCGRPEGCGTPPGSPRRVGNCGRPEGCGTPPESPTALGNCGRPEGCGTPPGSPRRLGNCGRPEGCGTPPGSPGVVGDCGRPEGCGTPPVSPRRVGNCGKPEGCGTPPESPRRIGNCGRPEGCGTPPESPAAVGDCGRPEGCGTPPGSPRRVGNCGRPEGCGTPPRSPSAVGNCGRPEGCGTPPGSPRRDGGCGRPEGCGTPPESPAAVGDCGRPEGCGTPPGSPQAVGNCGRPEGCGTPPGSPSAVGNCGGPEGCGTPPGSPRQEGGCGRPEGCGTPPGSPEVVGACGKPEGCGTPPGSPSGFGSCGKPEGCGTPPGSPHAVGGCGRPEGCGTPPGSPGGRGNCGRPEGCGTPPDSPPGFVGTCGKPEGCGTPPGSPQRSGGDCGRPEGCGTPPESLGIGLSRGCGRPEGCGTPPSCSETKDCGKPEGCGTPPGSPVYNKEGKDCGGPEGCGTPPGSPTYDDGGNCGRPGGCGTPPEYSEDKDDYGEDGNCGTPRGCIRGEVNFRDEESTAKTVTPMEKNTARGAQSSKKGQLKESEDGTVSSSKSGRKGSRGKRAKVANAGGLVKRTEVQEPASFPVLSSPVVPLGGQGTASKSSKHQNNFVRRGAGESPSSKKHAFSVNKEECRAARYSKTNNFDSFEGNFEGATGSIPPNGELPLEDSYMSKQYGFTKGSGICTEESIPLRNTHKGMFGSRQGNVPLEYSIEHEKELGNLKTAGEDLQPGAYYPVIGKRYGNDAGKNATWMNERLSSKEDSELGSGERSTDGHNARMLEQKGFFGNRCGKEETVENRGGHGEEGFVERTSSWDHAVMNVRSKDPSVKDVFDKIKQEGSHAIGVEGGVMSELIKDGWKAKLPGSQSVDELRQMEIHGGESGFCSGYDMITSEARTMIDTQAKGTLYDGKPQMAHEGHYQHWNDQPPTYQLALSHNQNQSFDVMPQARMSESLPDNVVVPTKKKRGPAKKRASTKKNADKKTSSEATSVTSSAPVANTPSNEDKQKPHLGGLNQMKLHLNEAKAAEIARIAKERLFSMVDISNSSADEQAKAAAYMAHLARFDVEQKSAAANESGTSSDKMSPHHQKEEKMEKATAKREPRTGEDYSHLFTRTNYGHLETSNESQGVVYKEETPAVIPSTGMAGDSTSVSGQLEGTIKEKQEGNTNVSTSSGASLPAVLPLEDKAETPATTTKAETIVSPKPKGRGRPSASNQNKAGTILPTSPQYQQVFLHQHQVLIMQYQQYQYQLQSQFQQLRQQQMSPQQQFLLEQQYHQQMMLLQQQFMQQQAELQRMASAGIQFTEQQLNTMYQQQLLSQQAYQQWIATLPPEQQMQLQARMQANLHQVQQSMAAMFQGVVRTEDDPPETKKKTKARRSRKSKAAAVAESPKPTTPIPSKMSSTPNSVSTNSPLNNPQDPGVPVPPQQPISYPATQEIKGPDGKPLVISSSQPFGQDVNHPQGPDNAGLNVHSQGQAGVVTAAGQVGQVKEERYRMYQIPQDPMLSRGFRQVQMAAGIADVDRPLENSQLPDTSARAIHSDYPPPDYVQSQARLQQRDAMAHSISAPPGVENAGIYKQQPEAHYPGSVKGSTSAESGHQDREGVAFRGSQQYSRSGDASHENLLQMMEEQGRRNSNGRIPPGYVSSMGPSRSGSVSTDGGFDNTARAQEQFLQSASAHGQAVPFSPSHTNVSTSSMEPMVSLGGHSGMAGGSGRPGYQGVGVNKDPSVSHYGYETTTVLARGGPVDPSGSGSGSNDATDLVHGPGTFEQQRAEFEAQSYHIAPSEAYQKRGSLLSPPSSAVYVETINQGGGYPTSDHAASLSSPIASHSSQAAHGIAPVNSQFAVVGGTPLQGVFIEGHSQEEQNKSAAPFDPMQLLEGAASNLGAQGSGGGARKGGKGGTGKSRSRKKDKNSDETASGDGTQKRSREEQRKSRLEKLALKRAERRGQKKAKLKVKQPVEVAPQAAVEDHSVKLPLCEPEVHLLYPLVQPYGSGYSNGDTVLIGSFGNALVQGTADYYSQFPSPDPPVTSSNPPTPPSSLPPSPGTINQSLHESLNIKPIMSPFEDAMVPVKRQRENLGGMSASDSSRGYPHASGQRGIESPMLPVIEEQDEKIPITLTLSNGKQKTGKNTVAAAAVAAVSDILGIPEPKVLHVTGDNKPSGDNSKNSEFFLYERGDPNLPELAAYSKETGAGMNTLEKQGTFCRHCGIVIVGSGFVRSNNDSNTVISSEAALYNGIGIQDTTEVFCSQLCLRNFYFQIKERIPTTSNETVADISSTESCRALSTETIGEATSSQAVASEDARSSQEAPMPPIGLFPKVKRQSSDSLDKISSKRTKTVTWRRWKVTLNTKKGKRQLSEQEVAELLEKYGVVLKPDKDVIDKRECLLCAETGDGQSEGTSRLLNYDVDTWIHLNCALWSLEVYETLNGALHNVQQACERGRQTLCNHCGRKGATIGCARKVGSQRTKCDMNFHFGCAIKASCCFFKDKTVLCPQHKAFGSSDQYLPSYAVYRKVYVDRDLTQQLAKVLRLNTEKDCKDYKIRVGSLIFHDVGQLLPHQLTTFHSRTAIFPVGFNTTRIYYHKDSLTKRSRYECVVGERDGKPQFTVSYFMKGERVVLSSGKPTDVWRQILEPVRKLREENLLIKIFPEFLTGEDLFGLTDPSIQRILESMPGADTIFDYNFRFGRNPVIMAELPLAINPTGCMRSEPNRRAHLNRPISLRTASHAFEIPYEFLVDDQGGQPKSLAINKTSQYKRLKTEWKNNVLLGRSRIQGLGLFARRDVEPNTFVIEYIGSIIRNELANNRERIYDMQNRGIYMFRIDQDRVIDATLTGGPARYINHSCNPNCVAEVVTIERDPKIIIISNRKIDKGEELTYDYKFEFEDDQNKIACLCGAPNCRKWMN